MGRGARFISYAVLTRSCCQPLGSSPSTTRTVSTSSLLGHDVRKDGTNPHIRAVDGVLAKKREDPNWRGQDSQAGGRPRALTQAQQKRLVALVFKFRGRAVVTTAFSKRRSCRQNSYSPMCAREICDYEPACGIQTPVPSTFRSRAECKHFFPGAVRACQALEEHTPRYASQPRGFSQWRPVSKQKLCPGVGLAERRCERRTLAWVWLKDAVEDTL